MVGRRRKHGKTRLAGSHQRCWIWGRNAVLQTLAAGRWKPLTLLVANRADPGARQEAEQRAQELGVPVELAGYDELTDRCRSTEHQGLMAMMPEYPYATLDDALIPGHHPPFVVVLEGIQDPQNFGAIIRSAEVFGADAIVVGEVGQCDVTPHVARASSGAVNDVQIARVPDVVEGVRWLQARGLRVLGASGRADRRIADCSLLAATAIVIGNEGAGLSEAMHAACDQLVCIPQIGKTESLNAAVAAGILCYEVQRQRADASKAFD
jgi:23S rRNA (guanosine2251-2'-O)-methyltransferase